MQGKKHYTEQLFKSFQLSQRVPEDNFYRRLKGLLLLGRVSTPSLEAKQDTAGQPEENCLS